MSSIKRKSFLSCNKRKSPPQLKKKFLEMINERLLQIFFKKRCRRFKTKKFQNIWITDNIFWLFCWCRSLNLHRNFTLILTG